MLIFSSATFSMKVVWYSSINIWIMMTPIWPILISPSLEELIKCLSSLYQSFKNTILITVYFTYTLRGAVEVRRGHQISCSWSPGRYGQPKSGVGSRALVNTINSWICAVCLFPLLFSKTELSRSQSFLCSTEFADTGMTEEEKQCLTFTDNFFPITHMKKVLL